MKILFTGRTDFKYNRVRVLVEGLKKLDGVELVFFPIVKRSTFDVQEFKRLAQEADFVYVPPFRHRDVSYIKKLTATPIVFDPLISKYLTKAIDYGHFWKAPFKYFLDKKPFSICDMLIADTQAHKDFFSKTFGIKPEKIHVVPVGVDTTLFFKQENEKSSDGKFHVGFYGTFVPLQGAPKIIEAARELAHEKDIVFDIIGSGYEYKKALRLIKKYKLTNINLIGWAAYDQLNSLLNSFDICLGIFGDSQKADAVIPNKIFHYASVRKCIVTKDTPGIREIFTHNENIVLCENSPEKIAEQILRLKNDRATIERIAQKGFEIITTQYNEVEIAKKFMAALHPLSVSHRQ